MKLLVGLGNPGISYQNTRHNLGFGVVDRISVEPLKEQSKFLGSWGSIRIKNQTVYLLKPETYMNESGRSVSRFLRNKSLSLDDILVLHDDLDLPPGKIRLKQGGGNGGHNGLKSVSELVGNDYHRLRIGIGRPADPSQVTPWVLGSFAPDEKDPVEQSLVNAVEAAKIWCLEGLVQAQRAFNGS